MAAAVRDAVLRDDPSIPVYDVAALSEKVEESAGSTRAYARLLSALAAVALLLCAVGIAGVIGFSVAQRTREIGVRIALGAARGDVLRLVVGESVRLAGAGLAAGLVGAFFLSRLLRGALFGIAPTDPGTFVVVACLVGATALAAAYVPARRAANVDPMIALREE